MRHLKIVLALAMLCLCGTGAQAQSIKDILTGVTKAIVGDKATSKKSIVGTWRYSAPACEFESDNILSKAGGKAAAAKIEKKIAGVLKTSVSGITYTINSDSTYTSKLKTRETKGTYSFNEKEKTITFTPTLGKAYTAYVTTTGSTMSLLFKADGLMSGLKAISNATSGLSSATSAISSVLGSYSGMRVGFEMKKK